MPGRGAPVGAAPLFSRATPPIVRRAAERENRNMTAERTSSVMALLVGMLLGLASRKSADSTEESNADRHRCRAHKGNDMKRMASVRSLALAALALLAACEANAVAFTGGVVSLVGGSGSCNKSQLTPLDTPQDTF